jgi:hypothetical protein
MDLALWGSILAQASNRSRLSSPSQNPDLITSVWLAPNVPIVTTGEAGLRFREPVQYSADGPSNYTRETRNPIRGDQAPRATSRDIYPRGTKISTGKTKQTWK